MKKTLLAALIWVAAAVLCTAQEKRIWPDGQKMDKWFRQYDCTDISRLGKQYDITEYGVESSDLKVQTAAIQAVIDSAAVTGGVVVFPKGTYVSGTLNFKAGTHLHLCSDAVLKASPKVSDFYLGDTRIEGECCKYFGALIQADGLDGFTISGNGTIDGNGLEYHKDFWLRKQWNPQCTNKDEQRPRLVFISNSKDVMLDGITMKDSPFWTTHIYKCERVKLLGLKITSIGSPKEISGPSTDGIDLDVVKDVLIKDCQISVNDDAVALKGGKGPWADNPQRCPGNGPVQNVLIEDCSFGDATHSCLTFGSEAINCSNVIMRRCTANCPKGQFFRLKMRRDTPQKFDWISVENCSGCAKNLFKIQVWDQFFDLQGRTDEPMSYADHITIQGCSFTCAKAYSIPEANNVFEILTPLKIKDVEIIPAAR